MTIFTIRSSRDWRANFVNYGGHRLAGRKRRLQPLGETYRCVGVSACAKHHQLRRDLLVIIAVPKSSLTFPDADTPIRRHADTLPQRCTSPIVLRLGAGLARRRLANKV